MQKRKILAIIVIAFLLTAGVSGIVMAENEEEDMFFELPFMITSAGQSPCFQLFNSIVRQYDLSADLIDRLATVEDLEDRKTLVVAIGGSHKGLGDAGIDPEEELERVKEVINEARDRGIRVLAVHTGRYDRFGDVSQMMIEGVVPLSDFVIVVKHDEINEFFRELAEEHEVPLEFVEDRMASGELFSNMIKVED